MDSHPEIPHHLMDRAKEQSTHQFRKNIFVAQNITKKRINTANFTNIYTKIHTYFICDENDFQLKNTLVNDGDVR